jgi:hypothetical protein
MKWRWEASGRDHKKLPQTILVVMKSLCVLDVATVMHEQIYTTIKLPRNKYMNTHTSAYKTGDGLSVVAHAYNPSHRRSKAQDQSWQKLSRPPSKNRPGMVLHACGPSYSGGRGKSIALRGWPGES